MGPDATVRRNGGGSGHPGIPRLLGSQTAERAQANGGKSVVQAGGNRRPLCVAEETNTIFLVEFAAPPQDCHTFAHAEGGAHNPEVGQALLNIIR